jgi:SAM-dependent methyltransferase
LKLYSELAGWWHLVSPPSDYAEEAASYIEALESLTQRPIEAVLELGSGGGNNASYLKQRWSMTLADVSEDMLTQSRTLNPQAEHVQGDMRTLRLGRDFDAVLIHDAIMYMLTEVDLAGAITTAAVHLKSGGVALFVPDDTAETYEPHTSSESHREPGRSVAYLMWQHPLPPGETKTSVTFSIVLKEDGQPTRSVLDEHDFGLFPRATWLRLIEEAGLEPHALPYEHSNVERWYSRYVMLSASPGQFEAMSQVGWGSDVRPGLRTISVPTLVLHRAGDRFVRVEHGGTSRRTSPARSTSNSAVTTMRGSPAIGTRCSTRWRRSSPEPAERRTSIASLRRCCSQTPWPRPRVPHASATGGGGTFWTPTSRSAVVTSNAFVAGW